MPRACAGLPLLALLVGLVGCASGSASGAAHATTAKPAPAKTEQAKAPAAAEPSAPAAAAATPPPAPPEPTPLPDSVDGPDIPRPALLLVLEQGVGRFLQKVSIEPHLDARGRFVGWRILELFPHETELSGGVLAPGDTLLRVNGQSIERPEQFMNVWESLTTESQLVLHVMRAGKPSQVRHRIVQAKAVVASAGAAPSPAAQAAASPAPRAR